MKSLIIFIVLFALGNGCSEPDKNKNTNIDPQIIVQKPLTDTIKTIHQPLNVFDENGWKQGMHIGASGSWEFERTYINDTLNGPFRKYSGQTTWETGFYKKHKQDSVWIEDYGNGTVRAIKHFKEGEKQGEFKTFYPNGNLSYIATFNADTLVGSAINYFENGKIKLEGNRKNGTWKTFYQNGQIASLETFRDGKLFAEKVVYDSTGLKILPRFVPEMEVDTCVINKTELNVKLLYQSDKSEKGFYFGEDLFGGGDICTNKDGLMIKYGNIIISIKKDGVELHQTNETRCLTGIKSTNYGTNLETKEFPDGEVDIEYVKKKVVHKISFGNLTVDVQDAKCMDTGTNPISLIYKSTILQINHIDNLQFFEFDVNKNGYKELYIISYASCQGMVKIYKISKD